MIQTEGLSKKFRRVNALDGLNLEVPQGAIYALVGPNGAGKTTAIKILMNIFGPTSGRAEIMGIDSRRIAGRAFASNRRARRDRMEFGMEIRRSSPLSKQPESKPPVQREWRLL